MERPMTRVESKAATKPAAVVEREMLRGMSVEGR
jgi:hypothetical protein